MFLYMQLPKQLPVLPPELVPCWGRFAQAPPKGSLRLRLAGLFRENANSVVNLGKGLLRLTCLYMCLKDAHASLSP